MEHGGFRMLWKLKLDDAAAPLSQPVHMGATYGLLGIKPLVFVASASGNVYDVDGDLGRVLWKRLVVPPSGCAAGNTPGLTRVTAVSSAAMSMPTGSGTGNSRGGSSTASPGSANRRQILYALSADGTLHSFHVQNGLEYTPKVQFLPSGANASGLVLIDDTAYVSTTGNCSGVANGVWSIDLASPDTRVRTWKSDGAGVAGTAGPAFGPDRTVYVATGEGGHSPARFADSVVALEGKSLVIKDWYSPGQTVFDSTPVVFAYKDRDLVAVSSREGRLHLLDSASLGGADHQTPLHRTDAFASGPGAGVLATYKTVSGLRRVLAVSGHTVIVFEVAEANGARALRQAWISRDLGSPLQPVVVNGVIFVAAAQGGTGVLYAFDGSSGRELWNSGKSLTKPLKGGRLSVGGSVVYVTGQDGTLFSFGFPIEH
jgi:outer membrane protein assembly factor BamB